MSATSLTDFFISYNSADRLWADWLAWQLEEAGYTTVQQIWDFQSGQNFILNMHNAASEAERIVAVLSPDYLQSLATQSDWIKALGQDPPNKQAISLVQVRECKEELLSLVPYLDLTRLDEEQAHSQTLAWAQHESNKPQTASVLSSLPITRREQPIFPANLPVFWLMPYKRNPFFTGRESILASIQAAFNTTSRAALSQPQALSGLGGIGKTQIAIEYAYRYSCDYQAVLWAQADSYETLVTSFANIADYLQLTARDARDQEKTTTSVRSWLKEHTGWLLILDNADDITVLRRFIPSTIGGHILITTRAASLGRLAQKIELDILEPDQGALFLLRSVHLLPPDATLNDAATSDLDLARAIVDELGGLPLALDQASAYIEETGCRLTDYLILYRSRRRQLLGRRGELFEDHPEPVATTWSLAFENVGHANPLASDLLSLLSFLHPDDIPEAIITVGSSELGPHLSQLEHDPIALDDAIAELRKYSLVSRHPKQRTLSIHRLVQTVLLDTMDLATRTLWAERTVRAVNRIFPAVEFATWPLCQKLLPHVQSCIELIVRYKLAFPEAAQLLNRAGYYIQERGRYRDALPLLEHALTIHKQVLGPDHIDTANSMKDLASLYQRLSIYAEAEPLYKSSLAIREQQSEPDLIDIADSLNDLASLYNETGEYTQAEPLYLRALFISEQELGSSHPTVAQHLSNLAFFYYKRGKYREAEPLYERALTIREQQLGTEHSLTAANLNRLANLYQRQGKYRQAKPLYQRALRIWEQSLGPEHPDVASSLNGLASLYKEQGKYGEAELLYQRALRIWEQSLGSEHPQVANSLNGLASLYKEQGKYGEAEMLYQRALRIWEQSLGPEHPDVANSLNGLAVLYWSQGKYEEAEPLFVRALAISEQQLGSEHSDTAPSLNNLANLYRSQGKYREAEPLYIRSLAISEQQLGAEHPDTAVSLGNLAILYWSQGKYEEAEPLFVRALAISEQQLGSEHPDTATSLNNLANLYWSQGKYGEAEPLYERALAIVEQQLGADHPSTAVSLGSLAVLYRSQGKYEAAEPLYIRSLAIVEQQLGADHPNTARSLNNLAYLYRSQEKYEEAEPLFRRALDIATHALGPDHPDVLEILNNLVFLLDAIQRPDDAASLLEARANELARKYPHDESVQEG